MDHGLPERDELLSFLAPYLEEHSSPGKGEFKSVNRVGVRELAQKVGLSQRRAMILCLQSGIWPERFRPNRGSLDHLDQARLLDSNVAVIGAGGLGGYVVTMLARAGIGGLTICDGDVFEESNLNRQALCNLETLGREKALCAAELATRINPALETKVFAVWATSENLPTILAGSHAAVDCLDNLQARYDLEEAVRNKGLPYVHGALAGWEGFVMTVFPGEPGLAGIYGPKPAEKPDSAETILGVPTPTPAAVASFQVSELIKLLLGKIEKGRRYMLHLDLAMPDVETMTLS